MATHSSIPEWRINSTDRGVWWTTVYEVYRHRESDTTEQLTLTQLTKDFSGEEKKNHTYKNTSRMIKSEKY